MTKRYLLAEQTIDQADLAELAEWLKTNPWLTQGPLVRQFEEQWAKWLGTRYATFVNSGSSANLLMTYALSLSGRLRNRKIIVPAVAWATTVAPAIQLGLDPILCEAESATFGLDPGHLEQLLREHQPGAVVVVHVLGVPADLESLLALQRRYDFILVEDACAATGSQYDGKRVGTFGQMSTFSFFYGHHMSTIEGGMVCTSDDKMQEILLQIRAHGWAKDLPPARAEELAQEHHIPEFCRPFTFYLPGFNVRSTDLNAKLGLGQLAKLDGIVERRASNHKHYQRRLGSAPRLRYQRNERAMISSISFAALAESAEHRDTLAAALRKANIETRPLGGGNMSRQPFWAKRYGQIALPVADTIHQTAFHLPNHQNLTAEDVDVICDTVLGAK